jgi:hypothetical protein
MGIVSRIGLDLDNTVIDYTPAYGIIAKKMGLPESLIDRNSIRPILRNSTDDGKEWQRFQSLLYTDGLTFAQPAAGLLDFLKLSAMLEIHICIVSHKTSYIPKEFGARDLRAPAIDWLRKYGIAPGFVRVEDVHFCSTREEKVQTISAIGCQVFVDDLIEVLDHPDFPTGISRFHYSLDASAVSEVKTGVQSVNFTSLTAWLASC